MKIAILLHLVVNKHASVNIAEAVRLSCSSLEQVNVRAVVNSSVACATAFATRWAAKRQVAASQTPILSPLCPIPCQILAQVMTTATDQKCVSTAAAAAAAATPAAAAAATTAAAAAGTEEESVVSKNPSFDAASCGLLVEEVALEIFTLTLYPQIFLSPVPNVFSKECPDVFLLY